MLNEKKERKRTKEVKPINCKQTPSSEKLHDCRTTAAADFHGGCKTKNRNIVPSRFVDKQ